MSNLLYKELKEYVYIVSEGESLVDISKKVKVSPTNIIFDNKLKSDVCFGDVLLIKKRGELKVVDEGILNDSECVERLKRLNNTDDIFLFMLVNV